MNPKFAVISLWAEDVPAAVHFYRDVIGLPLASHHGHLPHFDLDSCILVILQGRPCPAQNTIPEHFPLFALAVDDLEHQVQRLQAHRVDLPWGIESDRASRWVKFFDPAGNLIELVERLSE